VTRADTWLRERSPAPPSDLAEGLALGGTEGPLVDALTAAALTRFERARAHPGRVRESAYRLLEGDALLTYACEAALDTDDPDGALRRILLALGG